MARKAFETERFYRCTKCGHVYTNDTAKKVRYVGGETESFCPMCEHDDYEDVALCQDCDKWFEVSELYDPDGEHRFCKDCLEKRGTYEIAQKIGQENPTKINGLFEQFFTVRQIEEFLSEKVKALFSENEQKRKAIDYCMNDPYDFAEWIADHEEE